MSLAKIWQKVEEKSAKPSIQALVILLTAFVAFKALFIAPRFSDGNVYLYLGYLIRHGSIPYQDFFYSSPPLLPYLSAMWGSIFGFTWQSFGWLPIAATVIEASFLFGIAKKLFTSWAAVASVAIYLGSFVVLASTDFASDIHVVALFCLASFHMALTKRPGWAGFCIALACLTKIYAGVIVLALLLWYIWQKRWVAIGWYVGIFGLVFGGVNGVAWLLIGHKYIQLVILNNVHREVGIPKWPLWRFFLQHDVVLLLSLLPGIWFWRRLPALLIIPTIMLSLFLWLYPDTYYLYFKLGAFFLALWFGWGWWQITQRWPNRWVAGGLASLVIAAVGVSSWLYITQQSDMAVITDIETMVNYVAEHTQPDQTVYGDFSVTPLIARLANRSIANNLVDTNVKFFNQGIFSYSQRAQELHQARVPLLITLAYINPQQTIGLTGGAVNQEILELCQISHIFPIARDYESNALIIWQCET